MFILSYLYISMIRYLVNMFILYKYVYVLLICLSCINMFNLSYLYKSMIRYLYKY